SCICDIAQVNTDGDHAHHHATGEEDRHNGGHSAALALTPDSNRESPQASHRMTAFASGERVTPPPKRLSAGSRRIHVKVGSVAVTSAVVPAPAHGMTDTLAGSTKGAAARTRGVTSVVLTTAARAPSRTALVIWISMRKYRPKSTMPAMKSSSSGMMIAISTAAAPRCQRGSALWIQDTSASL